MICDEPKLAACLLTIAACYSAGDWLEKEVNNVLKDLSNNIRIKLSQRVMDLIIRGFHDENLN
jgi:hypothetical protein